MKIMARVGLDLERGEYIKMNSLLSEIELLVCLYILLVKSKTFVSQRLLED